MRAYNDNLNFDGHVIGAPSSSSLDSPRLNAPPSCMLSVSSMPPIDTFSSNYVRESHQPSRKTSFSVTGLVNEHTTPSSQIFAGQYSPILLDERLATPTDHRSLSLAQLQTERVTSLSSSLPNGAPSAMLGVSGFLSNSLDAGDEAYMFDPRRSELGGKEPTDRMRPPTNSGGATACAAVDDTDRLINMMEKIESLLFFS